MYLARTQFADLLLVIDENVKLKSKDMSPTLGERPINFLMNLQNYINTINLFSNIQSAV